MKIRNKIASLVFDGPYVEEAGVKMTPVLKLSAYLLAVGLEKYGKGKKDKALAEQAIKLADSLYKDLDYAELKKLGFSTGLYTKRFPSEWLAPSMNSFRKNIRELVLNNPAYSKTEEKIANFTALFVTDPYKPNYIKRLMLTVNLFGPKYVSAFTKVLNGSTSDSVSTGVSLQDKLQGLVKNITGKAGLKVDAETIKKLRESKQDKNIRLARDYTKMRGDLNKQKILDFSNYIAEQGDKPVPVAAAAAYMKSLGYDEPVFPKIGARDPLLVSVHEGKITYYTKDGRRLTGGIPVNATNITFMKTYNAKDGTGGYLSYRTPGAKGETPTKLYTTDHKDKSSEKKQAVTDTVINNIDNYFNRWKKDLKTSNPDKYMASTAAMLVYLTGMRVGSKVGSRSVSGSAATGALTLKVRDVTLTKDRLVVKYVGKKGVKQNHIIPLTKGGVPLAFRENMEALIKGKKPTDFVFSTEDRNDVLQRLPYSVFNSYLKSTGMTAGIHKIRHARGTKLMLDLLESVPFKYPTTATTFNKKQTYAEIWVKDKILTPVANLLGHKKATGEPMWQTSIQNYCMPGPLAQWFVSKELRIPKWIPKKLNED